jgi:hypothetical protein
MTEAVAAPAVMDVPKGPGLIARLGGVIFSPRATYTAVAARPRALGALVVTIALLACIQGAFLSTQVGKEALLNQQVRTMESFGVNISDQMYSQMEARLAYAPYTTAAGQAVFIPIMAAVIAGLLMAVLGMLMGGTATFKQVYAIVAHSGAVLVVAALFTTPMGYLTGEFASANLGVFAPMLEETSFGARFLGAVDLGVIWWAISVSIGAGVLFKRRTGGIAATLIGVYAFIALILALVRSGA